MVTYPPEVVAQLRMMTENIQQIFNSSGIINDVRSPENWGTSEHP